MVIHKGKELASVLLELPIIQENRRRSHEYKRIHTEV